MPEPKPTAPAAGQAHLNDQAQQLLAAIEDAMRTPTSFRDDTPVPHHGTAPPVPQPGRPPMSQGAVDASTMMLSGGVATVLVGGAASLVMLASGHADPTVCAIIFGAPAGLVLALSRLVKRAKESQPDEHHHHYNGTVYQDQRHTHTSTRGVWAKTNNQQ
ncbi:hypothetical protein C4B68_34080 [Streptomyces dengpaensis]|uniref:DUF3040 domain-containing protein n=1 Tax=Streptomyces dengpaensis TaxID=2049881 RepID=A0ABN5IGN2_9ACTN|nr:hypothetical protein C4B68_34080 [Streptomyces dengpaensis]